MPCKWLSITFVTECQCNVKCFAGCLSGYIKYISCISFHRKKRNCCYKIYNGVTL